MTGNADLRELAPEYNTGFERAIRQLGGEPKFAPGRYRIDFETGSVETCRLDPIPATGEKRFAIEDREETVLSTTQILCGKLERAPRSPVRDIFDFVAARRADVLWDNDTALYGRYPSEGAPAAGGNRGRGE